MTPDLCIRQLQIYVTHGMHSHHTYHFSDQFSRQVMVMWKSVKTGLTPVYNEYDSEYDHHDIVILHYYMM